METLNEKLSRPVVEEFELPSGKMAQRSKFSARDAMSVQREFTSNPNASEDDFMLLIICKTIKIKNEAGVFEPIFLQDFDTDKIDGFDYVTLFGKVANLSNKTGTGINPN